MDVIYKTYYTHFASTSKQTGISEFCDHVRYSNTDTAHAISLKNYFSRLE
jgi:hypothetical protein